MQLISQYWFWILLAAGAGAFFMCRNGGRGHGAHRHAESTDRPAATKLPPQASAAEVESATDAPVHTADKHKHKGHGGC